LGVKGVSYSTPNMAGTQGNARVSADAALCGTASESIVMSLLLLQLPEKYHDHDDAHIILAQCTARKEVNP
jgi:hypothetical protein